VIIAGKYSFNKGEEYIHANYSFMVYNVCAKMTIFRNLGHITAV
jgi:hypothetical protein